MNEQNILSLASDLQHLPKCMDAKCFKSNFGIEPTLYMICHGLLGNSSEYDPYPGILKHDHFLYALDFLKRYETEATMALKYSKSPKTLRKWIWVYVKKIAALKSKVVSVLVSFTRLKWLQYSINVLSTSLKDLMVKQK